MQATNPEPGETASAVVHNGPGEVVVVEGERFLVRRRLRAEPPFEYDYDWVSGRNPGYGFGLSGPFEQTTDDHAVAIRGFLANIDPSTGYLA